MSTQFRSGDSEDLAVVDPTSKAFRVSLYAPDGHEGTHSFPTEVTTNNATAEGEFVLPSLNSEKYKFLSIQLKGT